MGAKDMTIRIYSIEKFKNFSVCSLGGMSDPVVGIFFEQTSLDCYSVSSGGQLSIWESSIDLESLEKGDPVKVRKRKADAGSEAEGTPPDESNAEVIEADETTERTSRLIYKRNARHFLRDHVEESSGVRTSLTSADFHQKSKILVSGFSNGTFLLLSLPDASLIHSLSISDQTIGSVGFNATGDWIAIGCPDLGQLLVWEWQSETYVLKQQGHNAGMNCLAYSPDGSTVATGGEDAKVKLWNTGSGFCFVTFSEHESSVTGICYTPNGKVVLSSSLDGTVRAFDMARYRNFKTFTTPRPVQLSCVSVDAGGDLIVGGGQDVFEIYLWSLTTGRLVDVLAGHEGPVSAVAFSSNPTSSQLASVSWDKTLKIWDALESNSKREAIELSSEGIGVCWRPDGKEVSVSTLAGHILTFDVKTSRQISSISGKKDLRMGKGQTDKISSKKKSDATHFSCLCYSADGTSILAGGNSKFICIYNVREQLLIKRFEITQNRSFDCMDEIINRRKMSEFGNMSLIEDRGDGSALRLPGTKTKDMSSRTLQLEVRVSSLRFSPTGRSFSAVTSEGLLVYSLDRHLVFDPFLLESKITPQSIRKDLSLGRYDKAIVASLKLNEKALIREVLEQVPVVNIPLLSKEMPILFVEKVLNFIGEEFEDSRHLHFYLKWTKALLLEHGCLLKEKADEFLPILNLLIKNISQKSQDLGKVCDNNRFTIKYLSKVGEKMQLSGEDQKNDADEFMESENVEESDDDSVDMSELRSKWSDDEVEGDEDESDDS